jgi:hypothetical protein
MSTYRSFDEAALLNGSAGSLVAVLHAILVSGYGGRGGAGWTLAFAAPRRAVFIAHYNTPFYLCIDDDAPGGSGELAMARALKSMTSISSGTDPLSSLLDSSEATVPVRKSRTQDAIPRLWKAVATNTGLSLWIQCGTSERWTIYEFGDLRTLRNARGLRRFMDRFYTGQLIAGIGAGATTL